MRRIKSGTITRGEERVEEGDPIRGGPWQLEQRRAPRHEREESVDYEA